MSEHEIAKDIVNRGLRMKQAVAGLKEHTVFRNLGQYTCLSGTRMAHVSYGSTLKGPNFKDGPGFFGRYLFSKKLAILITS